MPVPVIERAEKVLMNISYELRSIQAQAYETQDRIAKQVQNTYTQKQWTLAGKPVLEVAFLVGRSIVSYDPASLCKAKFRPQQANESLDEYRKAALDAFNTCTGAFSSLTLDPVIAGKDIRLNKLQGGQSEITTFHQSIQSMIQTHDAALQRLQNMEGTSRQG